MKKSTARIVFELTFKGASLRLYRSGRAIFRGLKSKEELKALLTELLS